METTPPPRRWRALALVCAAFFMTILDVSIVNVALPSIEKSLHFSRENLQWVVTAYAITFGGFLLLGGRAADYLGRRRVFSVGVTLFTLASLVCGLAQSEVMLIVSLVVAALLLVAFVVVETRVAQPLMPLRIFRTRTVAGANVIASLLAVAVFSNFFLLTLYVQQVLGWSALKAGLTFLATAGTVVIVAGLSQALVTRVGAKWVLMAGLALITGAMLWYAQIPTHGHYGTDLLPGYVMMGFGLAMSFIPVSIAALAGVEAREAGLASGLLNTFQQIGGAVGLAIAATIATEHTKTLFKQGTPPPDALTGGFCWAFWILAAVAATAIVGTL